MIPSGPSSGEEGRPLVPTLGPRLSGSGILGSPVAAETEASEKGRRRQSGPRRLLRRPRGDSRPNLELAHCAWAPAGPCPPEVRFPPRGSRTPRDWGLFLRFLAGDLPSVPTLASAIRGNAHVAPAAGPGDDKAGGPPRAALRLLRSQPLRCGSVRAAPLVLAEGPHAPAPSSCSRLLRFLNSFGAVKVCLCSLL